MLKIGNYCNKNYCFLFQRRGSGGGWADKTLGSGSIKKKVRLLNTASSHCSPALLRALSPEFCGLAWRWASSLSPSPSCFYCSSPPVWRRCWWPHGSGWRRTWLAHHHGAQSWTIKIWLDFLVQEKRIRWPRQQSRYGTDTPHSQGCEAQRPNLFWSTLSFGNPGARWRLWLCCLLRATTLHLYSSLL